MFDFVGEWQPDSPKKVQELRVMILKCNYKEITVQLK